MIAITPVGHDPGHPAKKCGIFRWSVNVTDIEQGHQVIWTGRKVFDEITGQWSDGGFIGKERADQFHGARLVQNGH